MGKAEDISKSTASCTDDLFDLERDIPMTPEDVRVQRELHRPHGENLLPRIDELFDPWLFENAAPRRTTSEGWEPFELD